ncbi:MAG: XrtA system polysaccharide deacetylase [Alphaproteobacteria bacterium]
MTVDVEDYFQVQAFAGTIARADWDNYSSRVERNVDALLRLFADCGIKTTFFTLGWIAERHGAMVRRIVAEGHELGSHGSTHIQVGTQTPDQFRADVRRAKRLLEDTAGVAVNGYRAASFSIGADTLWSFDVLAEEGHTYSSSIYPIRHDLYGMPDAPRFPFRPSAGSPLVEIPITTVRLLGRNWPCGGGGYFRLLPYALSRWMMRRVNARDGQPCVFYFHPWEIDPGQPRPPAIGAKSRFRHYTNLSRMAPRLRRLAADFAWGRMDDAFRRIIEA